MAIFDYFSGKVDYNKMINSSLRDERSTLTSYNKCHVEKPTALVVAVGVAIGLMITVRSVFSGKNSMRNNFDQNNNRHDRGGYDQSNRRDFRGGNNRR